MVDGAEAELDADSKAFLAQVAAFGQKAEDVPVAQTRALTRQTMLAADRQAPEIDRVDAFDIPGRGGPVPVRVYYPLERPAAPLPLVLFFHGGSWIYGDLDCFDNMMRSICAGSGAVMVSVGYRLAPEHPFPAGLDDCHDALVWAARSAAQLGIDPARIAVMGDSAGGNLAAAVTLRARDDGGPAIARQILLYPAMDADGTENRYPSRRALGNGEHMISLAGIVWAFDLYLGKDGDRTSPLVAPIQADEVGGLPPAFIMTAGFDPLRDEARAYADRLLAAGVAVDYHCYETTIHGFLSMPDWIKAGREGRRQIATWITDRL
ncbi:MAG: alpha/beta hydrolase [Sphingomonadales bacterium]